MNSDVGRLAVPLAAIGIASLCWASPLPAQDQRKQECFNEFNDRNPGLDSSLVSSGCVLLSSYIVGARTNSLYEGDVSAFAKKEAKRRISPRDIQSTAPQGAATGGSLVQDEAVPGIQPLALAGGAVAASGTDAGANAIVALTVNPAVFAVPTDSASTRLSQATRFSDVTFLFPASSFDESEDFSIDYLGVRARINITGLSQGAAVMNEAEALFGTLVVEEEKFRRKVQTLLEDAPDLARCTEALLDGGNQSGPCGGTVNEIDESRYADFHRMLDAAREIADSKYFGLDLRLDFGDPTLGAVDSARGTVIVGGLSYGRRMRRTGRETSTWGFKTRLALRYTDLEMVDATNLSVDGGFALELSSGYQHSAIQLSTGIGFRYSNADDDLKDAFRTDLGEWRTSLTVPVVGANAVSMSFAVPFSSDIGPTFNVNLNWGLLLPG